MALIEHDPNISEPKLFGPFRRNLQRPRKENANANNKEHDNAEIYYKDWGSGRPVVFSHGWPLSSDCLGRPDAVSRLARLALHR
jgi:hypothetical protein